MGNSNSKSKLPNDWRLKEEDELNEEIFTIWRRKRGVNTLKKEEISPIEKLNIECLLMIFQMLPPIDRIRIERVCKKWQMVSHMSWSNFKCLNLESLFEGLTVKQIQTLNLEKIVRLSGKYINSVYCPVIRKEKTLKFYDKEFIKLFAKMENLKSITLYDIPTEFQGLCLLALPSNILEISLESLMSIHEDVLSLLVKRSTTLRGITIVGTSDLKFDSFMEHLISVSRTLEKFIFKNSNWIPENYNSLLNTMSKLINLEILDVKSTTFVNDEFLEVISNNCKKLKVLKLEDCAFVTNLGISKISKLEKLECLEIIFMPNLSSLKFLSLPNLEMLDCSHNKELQDDSVSTFVQETPKLRILNLIGCSRITNKCVQAMQEAVNKRKLPINLSLGIRGTEMFNQGWNGNLIIEYKIIRERVTSQ